MLYFMRLFFPSHLFHKLPNLLIIFWPSVAMSYTKCHSSLQFSWSSVDSTTTITIPSSQNLGSSRPSRVIKPSSYLKGFHCYLVFHNNVPTTQPFSHVLRYDRLSSNHKAFVCAISSHFEPTTNSQATKVPEWNETIMAELKALESNGTWTLD